MVNDTSNIIENKFYNENKKYIIILLLIAIISYLIRNYYFIPEIPLALDSLGYFFFAADITILGHLPDNYSLANNLWSIFLSLFFPLFQFENTIQYMDLQKKISMILSVVTIIPIYFLCKKFFVPKYAIIGSIIFAFEPRIIQNSMLGITESLYILLGTLTILFFLSSNKKLVYFSFLFASLTTMTRAEGQVLFFIISIMFLIRYRKEKMVIPKYLIGLGIFTLVLAPMIMYQMDVHGSDTIFGRAVGTISYYSQDANETGGDTGIPFIFRGIENFSKFFVWDLIPVFIFFVPVGIFYLFKKIDFKKLTLILWGLGISIPAFYIYATPLQDTRYLFMLYPVFCVISLFVIERFSNHFKKNNIIIIFIIIGIFLSSSVFLELKSDENLQKYEASLIAKEIVKQPKIMNSYPEEYYLEPATLPEKWKSFTDLFLIERIDRQSIRSSISNLITLIPIYEYSSINDVVKNEPRLTHIYVDQKEGQVEFLNNIFENENQYKFLIKEFDSKDFGYNYHVKIFRIDK